MYSYNRMPGNGYIPDPNQRMSNNSGPMSAMLDRWANPPQTQLMPSVINGRVVTSPNEIVPKEVPMDGSISVFPLEDLSAIIVKGWNSQGKLIDAVYVPEPKQVPPPPVVEAVIPSEFKTDIFNRLDNLEKALQGLMPKTKALAKKEDGTNG